MEAVDLVEAVVGFVALTMEEVMVGMAMWVGAVAEVCRTVLPSKTAVE